MHCIVRNVLCQAAANLVDRDGGGGNDLSQPRRSALSASSSFYISFVYAIFLIFMLFCCFQVEKQTSLPGFHSLLNSPFAAEAHQVGSNANSESDWDLDEVPTKVYPVSPSSSSTSSYADFLDPNSMDIQTPSRSIRRVSRTSRTPTGSKRCSLRSLRHLELSPNVINSSGLNVGFCPKPSSTPTRSGYGRSPLSNLDVSPNISRSGSDVDFSPNLTNTPIRTQSEPQRLSGLLASSENHVNEKTSSAINYPHINQTPPRKATHFTQGSASHLNNTSDSGSHLVDQTPQSKENYKPSFRSFPHTPQSESTSNKRSRNKRLCGDGTVRTRIGAKRRLVDASPDSEPSLKDGLCASEPRLSVLKTSLVSAESGIATDTISSKVRPLNWRRYHSDSDAVIKSALSLAESDQDLIADFSKPYALPQVAVSKNGDLPAIAPDTLLDVLQGKYASTIDTLIIVDCRYPYEYDGGHIRGAVNLYTKDQIQSYFSKPELTENSTTRTVVVFHCEFSSKRGPKMFRFLRTYDRAINSYPKLNFPEMYILEGGYKAFYQLNSNFCEPPSYKSMLDRAHAQDFTHFHKRSKSMSDNDTKLSRRDSAQGFRVRSLSFCY